TSLGVSASSADNVLNLSSGGETLSFSPDEGYVYDQNLNSYDMPAYYRNGTIYVPVKLCCGKFGFGYSTISVAGETILRVTDGTAQSDSDFTAAKASQIESAINTYKGIPSDSGGQTTPTEPPIPPVEEKPTHRPLRVYLTFYGLPNSSTSAALDALQNTGRLATFFLPTDYSAWPDELIRRIAAEGHSIALLLHASDRDTPDSLTAALTAANTRLSLLTGLSSRIVSNAEGCDKLTESQRDALTAAGYRLWDTTFDAGDDKQTAARAYATTAQYFASTDATVVLRLHHEKATAEALQQLLAYMQRQGIPASRITLSTAPMNAADDTR
ncbi:MAG: polysaccharide deacetylase family protein, partial [Agathobaculum sp.]|uniref:polysaccharide deacetylase family protein n=1 Tax=Agathobaculum sp. TaxID=2048138 RepID=UPI003D8E0D57